jgi:hypothetical protein
MQKIERLRFWGHSHVRMGTSPSSTDENTPLNYQRLGLPWFIRGIFNKLGRAEFTVYLFEEGYRFIDVPWVAVDAQTGDVLKIERRDLSSGDTQSDRSPITLPEKLIASQAERKQVSDELTAKLRQKRYGRGETLAPRSNLTQREE